jgi:hypothetical protein
MPTYKKVLLAAHTVLIVGMIIKDPSEAHRPPNLNTEAAVATVTITMV